MKKKFIETGKIVGTHGVKGMVRIQPWSDSPDFICNFEKFYLDENGNTSINVISASPHGNVVIAKLDGVNSIEEAERYRNKIIFIDRNDVDLPEDRYFINDLIGCNVFDADSNELLGILNDISATGANDVWHITKDGKEHLVPAIDEVIISVDIDNEKIILRPMKGIFDDEN